MSHKKGLENIIAGETAICSIGNFDNELSYRGYRVEDLSRASCFEEVSYLLIFGHLPTSKQLYLFQKEINSARSIPNQLVETLKLIPANTNPIDVLKVAISMLSTLEPETSDNDQYKVAIRLLAIFPSILAYWYNFHRKIIMNTADHHGNTAVYFLESLTNKTPDKVHQKFLNVALILGS